MRKLIALLVVICLLLVAADRIGEWEAGRLIASRVAAQYHLPQQPQIDVRGIPFLTQWAAGQYQEIDVQTPSLTVDNVPLQDVRAQLHQVATAAFVTSSQGLQGASAGSVALEGVVPYSGLPVPSGFQVTPQGNQLRVQGNFSVYGVNVPITATVAVAVQNGRVVLTAESVQVSSAYLQGIAKQMLQSRLDAVPTPQGLPFGVHLTGVQVASSGLDIEAAAQNVQISGS